MTQSWANLPPIVLQQILEFTDCATVVRSRKVNKWWRKKIDKVAQRILRLFFDSKPLVDPREITFSTIRSKWEQLIPSGKDPTLMQIELNECYGISDAHLFPYGLNRVWVAYRPNHKPYRMMRDVILKLLHIESSKCLETYQLDKASRRALTVDLGRGKLVFRSLGPRGDKTKIFNVKTRKKLKGDDAVIKLSSGLGTLSIRETSSNQWDSKEKIADSLNRRIRKHAWDGVRVACDFGMTIGVFRLKDDQLLKTYTYQLPTINSCEALAFTSDYLVVLLTSGKLHSINLVSPHNNTATF